MKIKTSKIAVFLNTGTGSSPTWSRIRKQNELNIGYDAETEENNFIDEDGPSTSVEKYKVSFDGEMVAYDEDEVFAYLDDLRQKRATGTDAETEVLMVYLYDAQDDAYVAEKNNCSVQITDFGGEGGGGTAHINYTVTLNGDPVKGTCTVTSGTPTFTEA